ncbi:hypothetical protein [Clostridium beijerinckii]|uniref:hypothetical protein n=1 Tax=Clostridium beijerinckii TaxID=1520 RepID=UPI00156DEC0C|nr:hypothetical protein [Clostridium beijerinckii]NRU52606.1 putative CopG family antitoxin [Clostridium beijerinckii]NYC68649.1 putative CopG family antitoxin [Clostridium beijerinckii]NYC91798.1 putative CopG family antitoxin [Clostridium beijerinckii]
MLNDMEIKQSKEKNTDELLLEIETLKKEKEEWKSNSRFLLNLVEQLQADNELLHNIIENPEQNDNELLGYDKTLFERKSSEQDEDYNEDELINAYTSAERDFKIS